MSCTGGVSSCARTRGLRLEVEVSFSLARSTFATIFNSLVHKADTRNEGIKICIIQAVFYPELRKKRASKIGNTARNCSKVER